MLPPMHLRDELPLNANGKRRAAYNVPFLGVYYTKETPPWVLVQERWEWWFWTLMLLAGVLPAVIAFLFYRASIEVHSHGLMFRSWCRHRKLLMKYADHVQAARRFAINHAANMRDHYPYLKRSRYWTTDMIAHRLMKYADHD